MDLCEKAHFLLLCGSVLLEQPELMQVKLTLHIQNEPVNGPVNVRQQVNVLFSAHDNSNRLQ